MWNKPNQYFTFMHNALPLVLSERSVNWVNVIVAHLEVFSIFLQYIPCILSFSPTLAQGFTPLHYASFQIHFTTEILVNFH